MNPNHQVNNSLVSIQKNTYTDIDLESLYDLASKNKLRIYEGRSRKNIGEILLNFDDQNETEAEGWIKKAIEADEKNDMVFHLGKDYALYAKLFMRKGELLKAKEKLAKAIEIFRECGADGWVEKYKRELAEL